MTETALNIGDLVVNEDAHLIGKVHRITVTADNVKYDIDFGVMNESYFKDNIHNLKRLNDVGVIPAKLKHSLTSTCPYCNYVNQSYHSWDSLPYIMEITTFQCKGCEKKYNIYIEQ